MGDRMTRDVVIDAAVAIVESEGLEALSMRALCEKLDVAVTSIYWHVGNKEAILDALVDRMSSSIVTSKPRGRTPEQRIVSTAKSILSALESHGGLVGAAHQRGRLAVVFAPARRQLAIEFAAAGLSGVRLAEATNATLHYVAGHCITMGVISRSPDQSHTSVDLWPEGAPIDRVAARRLQDEPDSNRLFEVGLVALTKGLIAR
ncbi:MAG: TetR family transcriptional regulator [Ilumatobacteraceae bacterium]